ncbi:uncharacterized protein LOC141701003 [Apium graveolens]|uniref:uncharacterized protein LOC141701003 n=1 Tax=Apium graveolens TaxID=4045 RepID=UPI003D7AD6CE
MEDGWRNGAVNHRFSSPNESPARLFQISSPANSSASSSPVCSPFSGDGSVAIGVGVGGCNYIEHRVSKFDTLAGVAIKYGVEVADIKKINGLVTDIQMFARKTLYIPLPGRHPPSPIMTNGFDQHGTSSSEQTPPPKRRQSDFFDSFQSLKLTSSPKRRVSPAMNNLQGYYGLKPPDQKGTSEGCELAVYQNGGSHHLADGQFGKPSPHMNPPLSIHRKSRSVIDTFKLVNGNLANGASVSAAGETDSDNWTSNMVRRRQKSEADVNSRAPEMLLKGETSNGGFSKITSKGLALRPKASGRTTSGVDNETGPQSSVSTSVGEFSLIDSLDGVKKSSSTPSFQDSDSSSSIWPTVNWSLKPDLQALSTVAISRPIFDGLPKPVTSRKNKTAVD